MNECVYFNQAIDMWRHLIVQWTLVVWFKTIENTINRRRTWLLHWPFIREYVMPVFGKANKKIEHVCIGNKKLTYTSNQMDYLIDNHYISHSNSFAMLEIYHKNVFFFR